MPTQKIYQKVIEAGSELNKLGLNGWETEFVIKDKNKKQEIIIDVKFKIKRCKFTRI